MRSAGNFRRLGGALLWLFGAGGIGLAQTPTENQAAFTGAAALTNLSYHWDSLGGSPPSPQVAAAPRTPLEYSTLTTLGWDPIGHPDLYQQKMIGSTLYDCTLVATFTNPLSFWDAPPGTEKNLTYSVGATTHYIFPYVTSGDDLHDYLRNTYFPTTDMPDSATVALRIQQSLGLPSTDASTRGLAFFWVPLTNLARSGYSADISTQYPMLDTYSDGSYMATTTGAPAGFTYVDFNDNTKVYQGDGAVLDFVQWNEAETTYPWTAMGYTYNWNALQDGSDPAFGSDPNHASSAVGVSEFVVSGGSDILLDSWIPYSELGLWVVPEPGTLLLFALGIGVVFVFRRKSGFR